MLVFYLTLGALAEFVTTLDSHLRGPAFVMEPPPRLEFSNSSGGWLDCSASGNPQPSIDWLSLDGTSVGDVIGIRQVLRNGTLVLHPFAAAAYRHNIHNTVYRCVASNNVGRVISREVRVHAVVTQTFKVQVEVLGAARGCTAILKCVVPSFVKELVRIISWVQEPSFYIYPTLQGDGKYHQLPSGDLLIYNVEFSDQFPTYRCKTIHRLSRQVTVSDAVNVQILEHRGIVSPMIVENSGTVVAAQDEGAALICISQGCPTPEYRWYSRADENPTLVMPSPRVRQLGPVLAIEAVTVEDSGTYQCTASNAGGEAKADIKLVVSAPLHVEIIPPIISVHMGGNAEFKCIVSALSGGPHFITWYKDGRQLASSGRNEMLIVNNVGREDRGMYQCVVRRAEGDTAQAAAELQLGDTPPVLTYSFIEQTLQPGPTVSLKCTAMGNPTPQISWSLDGYPLPSNGRFVNGQYVTVHGDVISHVNITQVMVEDGGEYTCTAESRAGKSFHSARLNVYGMPYIRLIPKVAAVAGETLQLKCPVAGYPIEEVHWERAGRELPDDMRQKVLPDGILQISRVEKKADTGVYTCWARNKQGHSARRSGEVTVIVPPIIEPFSFQDGLSEGMRTRTVCGVSSGDQPLVVSWLKDGQPLTPSLGANVSALDPYSSLLSISSLDSQHTGDFTCVASNPAAEVRYTAKLQVKVPPKWSVEPFDVSVERNRNVALHCQAQGVPTPMVTWKKATGSKSGEYQEIRGHMYTKLLENGTLLLQHIKEDREGFYLCQAENGIGTGIGKVIHLRVNSSPYFSAPSRLVTAKRGEAASLYCAVNGDKPINVVWLRGEKSELNPSTNYRIHTKQNVTAEGVAAELQIYDVDTTDSGAYFCQASNLYGKDQQLVQLLVQEPPLSPQNVEAAMISSRSVHLKWQHKSGDSNEVYKFIIEYREHDRPWQQLELSDSPLQFAALIEDLKPATRYAFRVIAEGPAGKSSPSSELLLKTEPQKPSGVPLNLSVLPLSSTELLVTWAPPMGELRNGEIQGFNIGYKIVDVGTYNFTSVNGDGEDSGDEVILSGLAKFMRYSVVVQAYNEIGAGPLSEPISAQTMEDVPSMPPEDVRCAAITSQSLQISWQPPPAEHCNGNLQGYKLMYEPVPNENYKGTDDLEIRQTTALTTVITGLRKFTNYSLQILSFTKIGDGAVSTVAHCQTEEDVPGPPADIKVVIASPQSFIVSWIPPQEPNGNIARYSLYKRSMDGRQEIEHAKQSVSGKQTMFETKGVQPGVEYQFWVTASTKIGEGQSSKVVTQVASTRVVAKILSFGGVVVRPWRESITLFCTSVGLPKQEWQHDDQLLKGGGTRKIMDSGDLILSNLQLSDTGNYTCQVDNGYGSDKVTYNLVVQVPPVAPLLYVTSATSSSILLHWKAGNDGGAPISGYSLNYRKEHGSLEEIHLSRHAISYELRGLLCGTTYYLYLVAFNKIGSSPASHPLHARTQGRPPGVPIESSFIFPNSTSVILRFHVWPDNGCPILYFILQYRRASDSQWILVSNALKPQRKTSITGLNPATHYIVKVEAYNIAGSSMEEFSFITLTKDGDVPPPDLMKQGDDGGPLYTDIKIVLPLTIIVLILLSSGTSTVVCLRSRHNDSTTREQLDNQQNAEAQRERYYATIHKAALQAGEKVPETSEDISPYATFQLSGQTTLPQNTMLHSFMYHEHAMTEGCASPPPAVSMQRNSPYYNIKKSETTKSHGRRKASRKANLDSEDSESDPDHLMSSRTESSIHLDVNQKHAARNFIYHGHSSTSSDLSPMSEQKSFPRRGRSRWSSTKQILPSLSVAETTFTEHPTPREPNTDRTELSEAECDIDTLKKLKLGLRSSLWSKPSETGQSSDYSIAV